MVEKFITLDQYKDSFDFFFGFNTLDKDKVDLFDNEYFSVKAYHWKNGKIDTSQTIPLKKCEQSDVRFLKVKLSAYYKNAICIADKKKLELQANWWLPNERIPFISI